MSAPFNNNFNNWMPNNVPQQQDLYSMGRTINNIVDREMGLIASQPYRNGILRSGDTMGRIWDGQFNRFNR